MAMPIEPPTSRVVSFTAEPTPAFSGGSELTMRSVTVGIRVAPPKAPTTRQITTTQ